MVLATRTLATGSRQKPLPQGKCAAPRIHSERVRDGQHPGGGEFH